MTDRRAVRRYRMSLFIAGIAAAFIALFQMPLAAPHNMFVRVEPGEPFVVIAGALEEQGVVTSALMLRVAMVFVGGAANAQAGTYRFEQPERLLTVAHRLAQGDYRVDPVDVVLFEGSTVTEMGERLAPVIGDDEAQRFVEMAARYEGYLFPDTYALLPGTRAREILVLLRETFDDRTAALRAQARAAGRDWEDVVIMASILEEEVRSFDERRTVSGILWNRIEADMPLQVDASFSYLFGKASDQVTLDDIATDSPYNTYKYKGLPPTPISNPGLMAIEAALDPAETSFWFYLSGRDGTTHYARTYEAHLENKRLYID